jgi:hypothetical protein
MEPNMSELKFIVGPEVGVVGGQKLKKSMMARKQHATTLLMIPSKLGSFQGPHVNIGVLAAAFPSIPGTVRDS